MRALCFGAATLAVLTYSPAALAQESGDPLLTWLSRLAQQQLDGRERAMSRVQDRAAADRRRETVRAKQMRAGGAAVGVSLLHVQSGARLIPGTRESGRR